jgi:hypothetical protein
MTEGTLITESLRVGTTLEGFSLRVNRIHREKAELSTEQIAQELSSTWTLIDFTLKDGEEEGFADALSKALDSFGWYANFQSNDESFIVFAGRVFCYPRGDSDGRKKAQSCAREQGVPETQLDWTI